MQLLCESYQVLSRVEIVFFLLKNTVITEVDPSTLVILGQLVCTMQHRLSIAKTSLPIFHVRL